MGWNIALTQNTVALNKTQAKKLVKHADFLKVMRNIHWLDEGLETMTEAEKIDTFLEAYDEGGTIAYYLAFNEDHLEHMDYVHQIVDALKEVKAQGQVCFGSLEGDNKGRFWGYYFDKGVYRELKGEVSYYLADEEQPQEA